MSELRVDSVKSKGGGAPDLPKGVTISGITTAVTLGATQIDVSNVNVSGVVTSATLSGELLSTGTPTLGLGVTINSSGLVISGVATAGIVSATTLYGDGTNLTGIGASIAPLFYQPDPGDTGVLFPAGIGITFNSQIKAGTGNVTLSIANAGVAGTVVENFGVGSSVTISENRVTIDPTADLSVGQDYIISYPSGCFTNNEGTDYVGTAYTFQAKVYSYQLWAWGSSGNGQLAQNNTVKHSSPVQIPGTTWDYVNPGSGGRNITCLAIKSDNTLWTWGDNNWGALGQNQAEAQLDSYSSPVQIPGTWSSASSGGNGASTHPHNGAINTDGELYLWGRNHGGGLGQNDRTGRSSPTQVPGTTWKYHISTLNRSVVASKTDGTLWAWGQGQDGNTGLSDNTQYSSPVQIGSLTTWTGTVDTLSGGYMNTMAIRTDGTLWTWGNNQLGQLGQNSTNGTSNNSPLQIPGTTWSKVANIYYGGLAIKTDNTLWAWGYNNAGQLGQNNTTNRSSPIQIPGTTWDKISAMRNAVLATKTDGTLWSWGYGTNNGQLGQNQAVSYSSPTQVGSATDWYKIGGGGPGALAIRRV